MIGVEAAFDIQRRSGDVGSRRAYQKGNGRSHLLGFAVTAASATGACECGMTTRSAMVMT
jgi:hypothetical protein